MQARIVDMSARVVVFAKPVVPGRVKTRLIGRLTADRAAELHGAFLGDLLERLVSGSFGLTVAWAVAADEALPSGWGVDGFRQADGDLGARLSSGLGHASAGMTAVAAVGSDHPELPLARVEEAFRLLEEEAEIVFGPAEDGGFYLVAVRSEYLSPGVFAGVPWSTERTLETTLDNCRREGLEVALLPKGTDVDEPADLDRLVARLQVEDLGCPRTIQLLRAWGWMSEEQVG